MTKATKRVAIYARVSTADQNTDMQLRDLKRFAKDRGWTVEASIQDKASGTKTDRKGLAEVMQLARTRKVDAVLVWKLDRFARSTRQLLEAVEEFRDLGVGFVSLNDPGMDTTTPTGKLFYTVMAGIAEFERAMIVERVKAGLDAARARGVVLGRKPLDLDTIDAIRKARVVGGSVRSVAADFGVSVGVVHKYTASNTMRRVR